MAQPRKKGISMAKSGTDDFGRRLVAAVVLQAVEDVRGRPAGWEPGHRVSAIRFLLSEEGKHCLSALGITNGCIEEFRKDLLHPIYPRIK
jgi:hypothetical protein